MADHIMHCRVHDGLGHDERSSNLEAGLDIAKAKLLCSCLLDYSPRLALLVGPCSSAKTTRIQWTGI